MRQKQEGFILEKLVFIFIFIMLGLGCKGRAVLLPESGPAPQDPLLMGYTIQTGAFSVLDNAIRMTKNLNGQGYEAFYFRHESGLFKVQLGDYSSFREAEQVARDLIKNKAIMDYFIVPPKKRVKAGSRTSVVNTYRDNLVSTAMKYISYPYTWGGDSPQEGFDCSGLVLAVYQLNGLNLPRTSREQYRTGNPIPPDQLKRGDLVFFNTVQDAKVSHVGIYAGNDLFIHAPGRNKTIRYDSLSSPFYSRCFVGACTYF